MNAALQYQEENEEGDLEGFISFVNDEVHARFRCTMHKLGNSLIEVDGDGSIDEVEKRIEEAL